MRVIIVGAGEVGSSIAATLAPEHEVVVVDVDSEKVNSLTYSLDVLAIEGDGTSLDILEEAGIGEADMLIACTDDDETNLVACGTAKTVDDPFTIARVKNAEYLHTWQRSEGAFGVDFMVSTDLLAAEAIVRVIGLPAARDVDRFAGGLVRMAEFTVDGDSPVADQTVREADRYDSLTFAAILRNGDVEIPRGDTVIGAGDRVVVIGSPESVQSFASAIAPAETPGSAEDVVVVGGSEIGYHTARLLEQRDLSPRLIERDPDRARELAEALPETTVLQQDATDVEFLTREHVERADAVVSALEGDGQNLLAALLAKQLGVKRAVAVVEAGEYTSLFEEVGVDVAVNPREATAEEIIRFTQEGGAENIALIESDRAEVLEVEVSAESSLAGRPIRESAADLPPGVVVGAITREYEFVTPRGDTVVEPGDHVIVFVDSDALDEVTSVL
jgi:trk system potassium uptake protein TrkA